MKVFACFVLLTLVLWQVQATHAKLLPQSKSATGKVSTAGGLGVYSRLRADRKALVISFSNLQSVRQVAYLLTYKTSGQDEAALGGLNLTGNNTQSAEILFGTCSKNVCRYHTGIRDARLEVSYTTITGKKYLKKFRIKI